MLRTIFDAVRDLLRSRLSMQLEIQALRHQLAIYQRTSRRLRVRPADRTLWSWLSRHWSRWREVLVFVRPETVLAWRRRKFREHWTKLSRRRKPGRPTIAKEVHDLIRRMSSANPLWGSPRIVGELQKIGIDLPKSTVEKYMVRHRKPPSPTWRAFLKNHIREIVEAFPWQDPPRDLLCDRDEIYGQVFRNRLRGMGVKQVLIAASSPWQNPSVERLLGSIRRECLDHFIAVNERHLRRTLSD